MYFNFSLFFMALGLACCIEAMPWLISPERMRKVLLDLSALPAERMRMGAFVMLALGLLLCAAGRSLL